MGKKNYKTTVYRKKESDCDVLLNDVENVFGSIGDCIDNAFDDKKSKMQVVGSIFGILGVTTKFLVHGTTCAVKNTPKVIATVASAKRELTDTITNEYQQYQQELKEDALDEKIKQLKCKKKDKDL